MSTEDGSEAMLYVTEFTMPDGTKRGPLVERVPECRPMWADRELHWEPKAGWFDWRDGNDPDDWSVSEEHEAVALFRCAVEDWLRNRFPGAYVSLHHDEEIGTQVELPMDRREVANGWSELFDAKTTIHHALVAAAHVVADILEEASKPTQETQQ